MTTTATKQSQGEASYPLSKQLNITFSPYEDRLIIKTARGERGMANLLMTRRMTMIVLHQLLASLPALTGLDKTPGQYWQEILQMAHHNAMQAKADTDRASAAAAPASAGPASNAAATPGHPAIYLATGLTVKQDEKRLLVAFKGLPMPQAMTIASAHEPVFATPLQVEHVHQLIQLLITKSQEAQWHLPVDLPWLENPEPQPTSLGGALVH